MIEIKKQGLQGVDLPNLDDKAVIEDLLRAHAMAVSRRLAEAAHRNVLKDEVILADRRAAAFLASTLMGENPAYAKAKVNTAEAISQRLRVAMNNYLALYEIKTEEVQDKVALFQFAMFAYTNEVHELINFLKADPDLIEKNGPTKLSELIAKWTSFIAGEHIHGTTTTS